MENLVVDAAAISPEEVEIVVRDILAIMQSGGLPAWVCEDQDLLTPEMQMQILDSILRGCHRPGDLAEKLNLPKIKGWIDR